MRKIIMQDKTKTIQSIINLIKFANVERDVFMELYRNSDELKEQMSESDCEEVFLGILKGEVDINDELIDKLKSEYA